MNKFTKIPANTFEEIQLNAGVLLSQFVPGTGTFELSNIIGATSGGINFKDTPSFTDYGDDIDNCPKNTKELKKLDGREVSMSGTFVTVNPSMVGRIVGTATISGEKVTPRDVIEAGDFKDLWWVGDYGDEDGGFVAIHMMNTLSTGGFQIQTGDRSKGNFAFEFTAHYSMDAQDTVPYEVYIKAGA